MGRPKKNANPDEAKLPELKRQRPIGDTGGRKNSFNNFKGKANTNGFAQNRENCGRKKNNRLIDLVNEFVGDYEPIKPNDIKEMYKALIVMTEKDILRIAEHGDNGKYPIAVRIFAINLVNCLKTGDVKSVVALMEQVAGKAPQEVRIDAEIKTNGIDTSKLSTSELEQLAALIEKCESKEDEQE